MLKTPRLTGSLQPSMFPFTGKKKSANCKRQKNILRRNSQLNSFLFFFKKKVESTGFI